MSEYAPLSVTKPNHSLAIVSNILSKVHLVDRTQAAAYAWNKGIVRRDD